MTEQDLLALGETYSHHSGLTLKTVGLYVADDGKFFQKFAEGRSCTLKRANAVVSWFSENWPDDLEWPPAITRPSKKEAA